jgi:hypothetical protein
VLNGTRHCTRDILEHFVAACGVTNPARRKEWTKAWERADQYRRQETRGRYVTAS